jgi:hypothetical protein
MKHSDDTLDLLGCAMAAIIATILGCWFIAQIFGPSLP